MHVFAFKFDCHIVQIDVWVKYPAVGVGCGFPARAAYETALGAKAEG